MLFEDRRLAAANNKVVAYSKALQAAEALGRLPLPATFEELPPEEQELVNGGE